MDCKVLLYIPAYNCAEQLKRTIQKINEEIIELIDEVIVIDNNSTDNTYLVAKDILPTLSITSRLLQTTENNSLGGSIKSAIRYSQENGFSHLIVLHGDDQADIRDFSSALGSIMNNRQKLVIGARFHPGSELIGYHKTKIIGNRLLNTYLSLVSRVKIYDLIAGLNLYELSIFEDHKYLDFPNDLTFDAHLLLYSIYMKQKIEYVPISWREEDQVSNAKAFRQGRRLLKLFTSYAVIRGEKTFNRLKPNSSGNYDYVVKESFLH